jgi:homoserine dehydrogenase
LSPLRIALLGFGTVGTSVVHRLTHTDGVRNLLLTRIFDRRADVKRLAHGELRDVAWTTRMDEVLCSDADVIVETVGGVEPAAEWIRAALLAGKSVVTANKQVIARDGEHLQRLAARQGRHLVAIARDRSAIVPPRVLSRPQTILGFEAPLDFSLQALDFSLAEAV